MEMDDFEWELSKENVKPLPGGRSVELLNKVLFTQHNSEFQHRRQQMRQHFELKISQTPASFTKLRLYSRYLRWVEQNYPSLGRTADLETLLYRCVRDVGQLDGVQNDQDFVDVWLRLIEYCAQPTELFELLFRQGVGTMCAKFYVAWANLLESKGIFAKTAAVYAHGLRTGAKPASWLEDRTESFLARYSTHLDNTEDSSSCFTNLDNPSVHGHSVISTEPARQQLAALRLVETDGMNENAFGRLLKAPAMRTSEMWHPHQSGLGSRNATVRTTSDTSGRSLGHRPQPRVVNLSHPSSADSENPFQLLHTLPPLSRGDSTNAPFNPVRPLSKPSQWQKENCPKPRPWKNEQIDRSKLLPSHSTRPARASFEVYSEEGTDASRAATHYPADASVPESSTQQKPSKRKGLSVLRGSEDPVGRSKSSAPRLTMSIFAVLFGSTSNDSSAVPVNIPSVPEETGAERLNGDDETETSGDVLQQLNLPSLPPGRLPQDAEFCIPLHWVYGGADEMCWEMHRAARLAPELAAHIGCNQLVIKAPVEDAWLAEERALQCELEQIVQQTEEVPKLPDDNSVEFTSARLSLIKSLESIVLSTRG